MPCLLNPVKLALLPTPAAALLWATAAVLLLALLPRAAAATLLLAARLGGFLYALQPQTSPQQVVHATCLQDISLPEFDVLERACMYV
jgi:hypothetical protein